MIPALHAASYSRMVMNNVEEVICRKWYLGFSCGSPASSAPVAWVSIAKGQLNDNFHTALPHRIKIDMIDFETTT